MITLKATPGPWLLERTGDGKRYVVGKGLVEGPDGYDVAEVYSDDCDPDEAQANANLIAAAWEMFKALTSLRMAVAAERGGHGGTDIVGAACEQADTALSKALGDIPSDGARK